MKKKCVWLLGACMMGLSLLGCGSDSSAEVDTDKVENEGKEVTVSIDAYGYSDGLISVTEKLEDEDPETYEYGSMDMSGVVGEKVQDVLTASGYSDFAITSSSDIFEGWMEFQMNITTDADGFDQYEYVNVSGDTLYTTKELMELEVPEYDVAYVAKWEHIDMDQYFVDEVMEDIVDTCFFNLSANGGEMSFSDEDNGSYQLKNYNYFMIPGDALQDAMSGSAMNGAILDEIKKDGAEFAGWTVYEADYIYWVAEEATDGSLCFPYESEFEEENFVQLENGSLYGENLSTEELKELVCNGKSFFAYAEWK